MPTSTGEGRHRPHARAPSVAETPIAARVGVSCGREEETKDSADQRHTRPSALDCCVWFAEETGMSVHLQTRLDSRFHGKDEAAD